MENIMLILKMLWNILLFGGGGSEAILWGVIGVRKRSNGLMH
jgi:hypothetical protein